jgi:hypothetical protein
MLATPFARPKSFATVDAYHRPPRAVRQSIKRGAVSRHSIEGGLARLVGHLDDPLIALVVGGRGIAVVPAGVLVPRAKVRVVPLLLRGAAIGQWQAVAWHPQRFLAPYAEQFVAELVAIHGVHIRIVTSPCAPRVYSDRGAGELIAFADDRFGQCQKTSDEAYKREFYPAEQAAQSSCG